jgi:glyoxylase-like metal-dependent hydrolase (beta-lactamase superfamily II)
MIIIKQLRVGIMSTFCYIVGDQATMNCTIIDPAFETSRILKEVDRAGLQVTSVINTHDHTRRYNQKLCLKI